MNILSSCGALLTLAPNFHGLLIGFLIIILVIAIIAGLIYAIETWIIGSPLPFPIKLVIGIVLIILVIIWAMNYMTGGT